jgi:hypothetical protein
MIKAADIAAFLGEAVGDQLFGLLDMDELLHQRPIGLFRFLEEPLQGLGNAPRAQ